VFASKPQLIGNDVFAGNGVIVERLPEPVSDDGLRIVQNRIPHEHGFQTEIDVLDPPVSHIRIKAVQLLVEFSAHRERASNQCGRFMKPRATNFPHRQLVEWQPTTAQRIELHAVTMSDLRA